MEGFEYRIKATELDVALNNVAVEAEKKGVSLVIEHDETNEDTIFINGKPIRVIYDPEWSYSVKREGILTNSINAAKFYDVLKRQSESDIWNQSYFLMLANAFKKCKRYCQDETN